MKIKYYTINGDEIKPANAEHDLFVIGGDLYEGFWGSTDGVDGKYMYNGEAWFVTSEFKITVE